MAIGLVVGAAALTFMIVTFEEQNTISSRTVATNQAEQGLEQLVRDLRDAMTSVSISSGARLPTWATTAGNASIAAGSVLLHTSTRSVPNLHSSSDAVRRHNHQERDRRRPVDVLLAPQL